MTTIKKLMRATVFVLLLAVSSITLSGCTAAQAFQIVAAVLGGIANIFDNVAGIVGGGGGGDQPANAPAENGGNQAGAAPATEPNQPAAAQAPAATNQPVFTAPPITTTPGSALDTLRKQQNAPAIMNPDTEKVGP